MRPIVAYTRLKIEVQAVRKLLGISVLALCLLMAGCKNSSSRGGLFSRTSSNNAPVPFMGTPTTTANNDRATVSVPSSTPDTGALASSGPTRREGVLAGRILDQESKLRPGAVIQVIDLESNHDDAAPLSVLANRDGYFDISGLEAGRTYKLVARVKEGERTMIGSARVVPPNVRVAIWLNEEVTEQEATPTPRSSEPAASIGAPIKIPASGITSPAPSGEAHHPVPPPVTTTVDPSAIADRGSTGEFHREAPRVNVPTTPGREHVPEKPSNNVMPPPPPPDSSSATPEEAPPSDTARRDLPATATPVPSCVRVGGRVVNFALYASTGEVYELAKDRKGKLVLIDLWHTRCRPCIEGIPHLNKLHTKYHRHGLEILGVAYEKGTLQEKQQALEKALQRLNLTFQYRLLFGGGGPGKCPLAEQLEQHYYPTMILLDENGKILYRAEGIDPQTMYELEATIYDHLFPRRRAGR